MNNIFSAKSGDICGALVLRRLCGAGDICGALVLRRLCGAGEVKGDIFPSTEAFITDQSGNTNLFLGASLEKGGLLNLCGDNKNSLFKINMTVNIDDNGNFTGVTQGNITYTVKEWNSMVQKQFNSN